MSEKPFRTQADYLADARSDMEFYDRLPNAVRKLLQDSPIPIQAEDVNKLLDKHGYIVGLATLQEYIRRRSEIQPAQVL